MKKFLLVAALLSFAGTTMAAGKNCEELKAEVDAKLQSLNVKSYTLQIVTNEEVKDRKIVGTCAAGTHKLIYTRN
ncbi:DUF1161 domain-containing protein [Pseudomonas cichorii]|uniref:DUF1161 domain-containing protein n=1 Tax=Pseudomonas lijiangensis TaxID=2995658 RepID=A0ABX8HT50_9PSED|nr:MULTISPECIES: DUF1161 domain-containing protein [Pseudomonas syringae group]MBI6851352.1 DUF1161 domain-containing protein [Pseudomonas cichorii]MBX8492211.1 DUF1161 domain-containing protein [Pseudomonas cichorii]MBX8502543.1 DUF1161 domain-containing protein [Pseudomonas lijiangensis]MBX8507491.1 DUF1161 domain-containing protein [Pseudomonas lijiangensis]MBX8510197.1 DUF1161 domain-containing protein [Pseudomonas cichorii]